MEEKLCIATSLDAAVAEDNTRRGITVKSGRCGNVHIGDILLFWWTVV